MFQWARPLILKPKYIIAQSDVIISGNSSAIYYPQYRRVSCDLHPRFSDYITKFDLYSHKQILDRALRNRIHGKVLNLGTSSGSTNFWHWMHEVCARLIRVKGYFDINYFDKIILPPIGRNDWAVRFIEMTGVKRSQLIDSDDFFYVDEMVTANIDKMSSSRDLGQFFRRSHSQIDRSTLQPNKIFLERKNSSGIHSRTIFDMERHREKYISAGFTFVQPELLSPLEQVAIFLNADTAIGASGSAFTLCGLMSEGKKVVELFSKNFLDPAIAMNCACSSLRYGIFVESGFRPKEKNWQRDFNGSIDGNKIDHDVVIGWSMT